MRGYVSKIDGSVQPYGLVVPPSYSPTAPHRWRLDLWYHGRNETLSQLNFLTDREKSPGEFSPRDTIVLHLYGRYCNASKFAGEVDTFEALDAVRRAYPIDENRILVRGFSMGGASVWHIAAHYPGLWAAAAPGAGFAETARYQKMKLEGPGAPPWWEQKLFHYYDATDYAANFFNLPVIEYHGEIDPQQQAGDVMAQAMAEEGMRLARIEGPGTQHKYEPGAKIELAREIDAIAARGRDPWPRKVRFTTFTLRYNNSYWVTLDSLGRHWERARVDAEVAGDSAITVTTANVTALTLAFGPGGCPLDLTRKPAVTVDGQKIAAPSPGSDRSWSAHFRRAGDRWTLVETAAASGMHKRHGLQGPIDDAFLDRFIFVTPTGAPFHDAVGRWAAAEEKRAIAEWRRQFRGDAIVRDDRDITDADIASANLVLWGDPSSNRVLARIADRLPVRWTAEGIVAGANRYPAATHARDPDLSQSAQPESVRGAEQRVHFPRSGLHVEFAADAQSCPITPWSTSPRRPTAAFRARSCSPDSSTRTGRCSRSSGGSFAAEIPASHRIGREECGRSAGHLPAPDRRKRSPRCARGWRCARSANSATVRCEASRSASRIFSRRRGWPPSSALRLYEGRKGECDAPVVTSLRRRGAILLGKTRTTAFASFDAAATRNPRLPGHTPGGSSAGSAAAVAAGMVPFALGTQTLGSVLRPASFCGVCGFKPTSGLLSTEGVMPFAPSLDTVGLFTESAADMAGLWSRATGERSGG